MESTVFALESVWEAITSWFEQVESGTGIPLWDFLIAFAVIGIVFRLLVKPMIGGGASDSSMGLVRRKGNKNG